jgi:Asp-tRNA(Asn)/Glu-tRNA(Gln) amidotransferase A subunit family amidase
LHGVAVGIKDVIDTKGNDTSSLSQILVLNRSDMPTQYGSSIYRGYQPNSDSSAIAILRAAGALIIR